MSDALITNQVNKTVEIAGYDKSQTQVVALAARARGHRITDDISRAAAADIRAALKQSAALLEDARTSLVKPLNDHVRMINGKFKPLTDALEAAVYVLDQEITRDRRAREAAVEAARREQERLLEEERRKAEEEQAARAREIAAQASTTAVEVGLTPEEGKQLGELYAADELARPVIVAVPPPAPPPPPKTIAGTTGSTATVRQIWDFEVIDKAALAADIPEAIEVKRKPILERLLEYERKGLLHFQSDGSCLTIPGLRAFKRDSVSG